MRAFQPGVIGPMVIKNRLVRSATFEQGATDEGEVTDFLVGLYRDLAKGGVGLIVTGHAAVHPRGYGNPKMMRISDDRYVPGLSRIAKTVHDVGNECRVFLQLNHAGRQQARPELAKWAVAPSPIFDVLMQRTPRALSLEEIEEIVECFALGVLRAREAGFDGAELHSAHGWLLSSFLSPCTNKRSDAYGGATENRVRILVDIYRRSRRLAGDDFPILVKMNTEDFMPGGMDVEESKSVAALLAKAGFAALDMSGGMWVNLTRTEAELGWKPLPIPEARVGIRKKDEEAYFWSNARKIKQGLKLPFILVGGIRSPSKIEEILEEGSIDFCAMSRPFVREPDLPDRWRSQIPSRKAVCTSCNACLPLPGRPLECRFEEKEYAGGKHLLGMFPFFRKK